MKPFVRSNAKQHRGVVTAHESCDFGIAVAAVGMVADEPPELMAGSRHGASPAVAAQFVTGDTATVTYSINQVKQATAGKCGNDGVWVERWVHGVFEVEAGATAPLPLVGVVLERPRMHCRPSVADDRH